MKRISKNVQGKVGNTEVVRRFVKENYHYLSEGEGELFADKIEDIVGDLYGISGEAVYAGFLKEVIEAGDMDALKVLLENMVYSVPLLKKVNVELLRDVDVPRAGALGGFDIEELSTPFFTEDPEVMELLLGGHYDYFEKKIMWTDKKRLYFMEATPMAAALACGNAELFRLFIEKGSERKGFCTDYSFGWMEHFMNTRKKKTELLDFYSDAIMERTPCRLWSPEEAALLSGNLELIKQVFDSDKKETVEEHLGSFVVGCEEDVTYKYVYNHHFPDALYWMDEEECLYIDRNYPMLRSKYQLDKIIESGNYVLLGSYLNEHNSMKPTIVESLIERLQIPYPFHMTFGMLEEKVSLANIHCIPFDEKWLEERKKICIETLKTYQEGKRGFILEKSDMEWDSEEDGIEEDVEADDDPYGKFLWSEEDKALFLKSAEEHDDTDEDDDWDDAGEDDYDENTDWDGWCEL